MKITSFNSLFYNYSNNASSFRDQILVCRDQILKEQPDVAVFLEMPNPHQSAESNSILMLQHLQAFEVWLTRQGYVHQRKLNNMLSVWVVSKLVLVPLLLLGADTVGGAAAKVLKVHPDEWVNRRVDGSSDYVDCAGTVLSPHERSIICGVVSDEVDEQQEKSADGKTTVKKRVRRVLPLIATHARCLYQNTRFGGLLFNLLRAFVAKSGIVIGDMNVNVTNPELLSLQKSDERLQTELPPGALDSVMRLPMCPVTKHPGRATCTGISFPFQPLNIDGVFAPTAIDIAVRSLDDEEDDNGSTVGPSEIFPSDHRWIAFTLPKTSDAFLRVPVRRAGSFMGTAHKQLFCDEKGDDTFVDARVATYLWSESMPELMALCDAPVVLQRTATLAAVEEAAAAGVPFVPASPPGGGGGSKCYNCGGEGHFSRECPHPRGGGGRSTSQRPAAAAAAAGAAPSSPSTTTAVAPRPPRSLSPAKTAAFNKEQLAALAPPRTRSKDAAPAVAPTPDAAAVAVLSKEVDANSAPSKRELTQEGGK